jgi:Fe-Mn family superoxide dismutase
MKGPELVDRNIRKPVSRRDIVGGLTAGAATVALGRWPSLVHRAAASEQNAAFLLQSTPTADVPDGPFTLDPLPYDYAALEPHIDALTMQIHHDKHHQTYVDNLNKAVADLPDLQAMTAVELISNLDQVPEEKQTAVRNNAGGHVNHSLFWELMTPGGRSEPSGALADAIASDFGDLAALQEEVTTAGLGRFGSGWAWVIIGDDGKLAVTSTPNQDNPVMEGGSPPILGVDV